MNRRQFLAALGLVPAAFLVRKPDPWFLDGPPPVGDHHDLLMIDDVEYGEQFESGLGELMRLEALRTDMHHVLFSTR